MSQCYVAFAQCFKESCVCVVLCPAEVDEFLQQTEKYIKDLTHRLVSYKAKEEAQEAAQEAIAEVGTATHFGRLAIHSRALLVGLSH